MSKNSLFSSVFLNNNTEVQEKLDITFDLRTIHAGLLKVVVKGFYCSLIIKLRILGRL